MKKIFSAVLIFGLIGFDIDIPDIPRIDVEERIKEIGERMPDSSVGTYADTTYSNRQTSFSSGQTVYFFAKARVYEDAARSLILQDADKNKIRDIPVIISQEGYAAQFNAPQESGMYYLHFEVIGEGLSIVFETNINVGNGGEVVGDSVVVSDVTTEVISGDVDVEQNEIVQKMPNNRLNSFQIVGWWVRRLKELIIYYLTEA